MEERQERQTTKSANEDKQIWIEDDADSGEAEEDVGATKPATDADAGGDEDLQPTVRPNRPERDDGEGGGRRSGRERMLARLAAERPHFIPLIQRNESIRAGRRTP
jgi:hypothetical protein